MYQAEDGIRDHCVTGVQTCALPILRDQKYEDADKSYKEAAENAESMGQWVWQARAYRIMAMYQADDAAAAKELDQAEAILASKSDVVAKADLDEERARILRVRLEHAVARNDHGGARKLPADP